MNRIAGAPRSKTIERSRCLRSTTLKQLPKNKFCCSMSGQNAPNLHVSVGETFALETEDCFSGTIQTPQDASSREMRPPGNPATGPVFIEGTAPGDILCVEIEKIETADQAIMLVEKNLGALGELVDGLEIKFLPIRDGRLVICETLSVPVRPMIGVLGVAPPGEPVPTITPGSHGGNMDCKEITAGSSVYLPVAVEGALLAGGDLHAVMGDGEVCICGAEVSGRIVLRTRVLPSPLLPTPCVETREHLLLLASAETLDECERKVLQKAHRFLVDLIGLSPNESARIMSLLGELGVCQVVDPLKTMKFMFPKEALRALDANDRLGEILDKQ